MTDNGLLSIAKKFDPSASKVVFHKKSHNLIYKAYGDRDNLFILRLTSAHHRSIEQIIGELDFQNHLFENGAPVVRPLSTQAGEKCVPVIFDGAPFSAAAFSYAKGDNWNERCDFTENRLYNIGKALGKIHNISKKYVPDNAYVRRRWDECQHIKKADIIFADYDKNLHRVFTEFMARMRGAPQGVDCFGLTHGDFLLSNYIIDGNDRVSVFDFDECEYSWFAVDLAICMHCYLIGPAPESLPDREADAEMIHYNLLLGYRTENKICADMVFGLEPYFRIRDFIYLSTILEKQTELNGWARSFIRTCMDRILNNKRFLEFDISRAAKLIT